MKRKNFFTILGIGIFIAAVLFWLEDKSKSDFKPVHLSQNLKPKDEINFALNHLEIKLHQQQVEMAAMLKSVHKESKSHLTASVVAKQDISLTTASYERKWPTFYYRDIGSSKTLSSSTKDHNVENNAHLTKFSNWRNFTIDKRWWQGLNASRVQQRYPGIIFNPSYRTVEFLENDDEPNNGKLLNVHDVTDYIAEEKYYKFISSEHVNCMPLVRAGNEFDGGWTLCFAEPYSVKAGCIVYSFGINNDFSFDDEMSIKHGCYVYAFDPSMSVGDHKRPSNVQFYQLGLGNEKTVTSDGWKLNTLKEIMEQLGHIEHDLDILKIDIDDNEWDALRNMIRDGSLRRVRQLVLEVHTPEIHVINRPSIADDFIDMYNILLELEKIGFRRYHYHINPTGIYTSLRSGKSRSCCYDLSYINIRYLKPTRMP